MRDGRPSQTRWLGRISLKTRSSEAELIKRGIVTGAFPVGRDLTTVPKFDSMRRQDALECFTQDIAADPEAR